MSTKPGQLHDYVAAVRARLDEFDDLADTDRERVTAWLDWVDAWKSRRDPTVDPRLIRGLNPPAPPRPRTRSPFLLGP